jgi:hypothetical protein
MSLSVSCCELCNGVGELTECPTDPTVDEINRCGIIPALSQLERRLISFAAAIVSLSSKRPRTPQSRHIAGQILRSGTAAAANDGEARGAESRADFIQVPCFHRKILSG